MMTTFHNVEENYKAMTKGAPDIIISNSSKILLNGEIVDFTEDLKQKAMDENKNLAKQALRVMAYAFREFDSIKNEDLTSENIEREMVFVGLTGMIDPPRPEAKKQFRMSLIRN